METHPEHGRCKALITQRKAGGALLQRVLHVPRKGRGNCGRFAVAEMEQDVTWFRTGEET